MIKRILLAASTVALIAVAATSVATVTSSTASAQRGFGCATNPARCTNQLRTPDTFGDQRRARQQAKARKKAKKR
jgi:hypothetical protein